MSKLGKPADDGNDAATIGSAETLDREDMLHRDSQVNASNPSTEIKDPVD